MLSCLKATLPKGCLLHQFPNLWCIRTTNTHFSEQTKQNVGVERPLMSFVHNDSTVLVQVRLPQTLSQQNTISHILDLCFLHNNKCISIIDTDHHNTHTHNLTLNGLLLLRKNNTPSTYCMYYKAVLCDSVSTNEFFPTKKSWKMPINRLCT